MKPDIVEFAESTLGLKLTEFQKMLLKTYYEHKDEMINPLYSNIGKGNKKVIAKVLQALKENYGMVTDEKYLERVIGHCKDCKYFEYDSVAKVNRIPLIIAHEICLRWGDGCKTREDGYCFLFEPKEKEEDKADAVEKKAK